MPTGDPCSSTQEAPVRGTQLHRALYSMVLTERLSGVEALLTETASQLLERVGDVYDLVSFDPRGTRLHLYIEGSSPSNIVSQV